MPEGMRVNLTAQLRALVELIEALDQRLPQVKRAGEAGIATDAAALRASAVQRIKALERRPPPRGH